MLKIRTTNFNDISIVGVVDAKDRVLSAGAFETPADAGTCADVLFTLLLRFGKIDGVPALPTPEITFDEICAAPDDNFGAAQC